MRKFTKAAIAAMVLSAGAALAEVQAPVCGDFTSDSEVKTTDALLVLKKAVDQPIVLDCSGYQDRFSACQSDLSGCQEAPKCGNGDLEGTEDCEADDLGGKTCVTQGFAGGALACAAGCTFDTSGCWATRFDASGDTIIDHQTGLEWEKKTGTVVADARCFGETICADPHDVNNRYQWSSSEVAPDGSVFTDFLVKLNAPDGAGSSSSTGPTVTGCYGGHCDWRLPTISELQTIMSPDTNCGASPCVVDSAFLPTQTNTHWSSTTLQHFPWMARLVSFEDGIHSVSNKIAIDYVRAVRARS